MKKTDYSFSSPDPGEWRAGVNLLPKIQADKHSHSLTHTYVHALLTESKSVCTWTSIQLPCLCNVSFTEPGSLANSRPDPIFISGWKDGVKEHPTSGKGKEPALNMALEHINKIKEQSNCREN